MANSRTGSIAVFSTAGKQLEIQSYKVPVLQEGEILIKNLYTTLCGSDLHTFCGLRQEKTPTVLGHEIVGRIEEINNYHSGYDYAGKPLQAGDIVTWSIFVSDPQSLLSMEGIPQKGDNLFKYGHAQITGKEIFHGGLAEYCILKSGTAIWKVPEEISLPVAATINCAMATVAGALRMAGSLQGRNVLITGTGLLGIICISMCKDAGAAWIAAADISKTRLEHALPFGADKCFLLEKNHADILQQIKATHSKGGVDIVFDMSGSPDAMEMGLESLSIGGTAVWIGAVFNTRRLQIDAEAVIRKLITIKGLHNYNYIDFQYALDFLTRNIEKYPFSRIVDKEFPLFQVQQAFEYAVQHKPLRVGVKIS